MLIWNEHPNGECGACRTLGAEGYYVLHAGEWAVSVYEENKKWSRTVHEKVSDKQAAIELVTGKLENR